MPESPLAPLAPLAAGSISLRMYPHALPGPDIVRELCDQARLAEDVGFDGLMTSEHHGGFPGYLPNPLQIAGFLLGATDRIWAAPCPLLLPLRHDSHVAEDLAWMASRFPGRVGAGFAIGGLAQDFEMAELGFDEKLARFKVALPRIVAALSGKAQGALAADPAIAECARAPMPLLSAAQSPGAVRRAAATGTGLLFDSLQTPDRVSELNRAYQDAGGRGRRCLIRRAWLGPPPRDDFDRQRRFYESYTTEKMRTHWGGDELVSATKGTDLADQLLEILRTTGSDSLNLRVHVTGLEPAVARDQIERVGREVLPRLRDGLADHLNERGPTS